MARFLVDDMCGRLARYLRFCGHDAADVGDRSVTSDAEIRRLAREEDRTPVTRDRHLGTTTAGEVVLLTSTDLDDQLRSMADAGVDLAIADRPRRCGRCNGRLDAPTGMEPYPEYVPDDVEAVYRCRRCGQYFWSGSHHDRVWTRLHRLGLDGEPA